MATEVDSGPTSTEHRRLAPSSSRGRPLERAQLVWQRALELVDAVERPDRFEVAGDLSRTAHHDPTTMAHALALGRTQLRAGTKNAHVLAAVGVLERAVVFLGVKPIANDTAGGRRRR